MAYQVYDYQLCLSVFHWLIMNTKSIFEDTLAVHLLNARTTFIELPEAMNYSGLEGQHAWKKVNRWYDGRDEVTTIKQVAASRQIKVDVKILGALAHDTGTVRKMIRVDVLDAVPSTNVKTLLETYKCQETFGGQ
jgi:hypothetical protein